MKNFLWLGLFGWCVALADSASAGSAEADWATFRSTSLTIGQLQAPSPQERSVKYEQLTRSLGEQGLAFFERYPADPRRWEALQHMLVFTPRFITAYGPDFDRDDTDVTWDLAAAAAWQNRLDALVAAADASAEISAQTRESLDSSAGMNALRPLDQLLGDGRAVDWDALLARVRTFIARYPASKARPIALLTKLMFFYEMAHSPEASAAVWREYADSSNEALREGTRERLRFFEQAPGIAGLHFTAVDGRPVDLTQWHGKVVLVEFWATWCGPCAEEIPNVVANYRKYHDQGFEVVGLALERAQLAESDTPEQQATKLAKAKKVLTTFLPAHDMPWPQFFATQEKQSAIAREYAIELVPTMYLLDQNGRVVGTNVRGRVLGTLVKQLLKP
jgi:thiol-disulfide isomerase/thioredoxin